MISLYNEVAQSMKQTSFAYIPTYLAGFLLVVDVPGNTFIVSLAYSCVVGQITQIVKVLVVLEVDIICNHHSVKYKLLLKSRIPHTSICILPYCTSTSTSYIMKYLITSQLLYFYFYYVLHMYSTARSTVLSSLVLHSSLELELERILPASSFQLRPGRQTSLHQRQGTIN